MSAVMPTAAGPACQRYWDWRAAGNFIGGGAGAGMLVYAAAAQPAATALILPALALICGGLLCVWFEIGRPWRALNVYLHPQSSWMTRESIVAVLLLIAGMGAVRYDGHALSGTTAALALAYVYSQARMLQAARGIPAWRAARVVPLLVATGLAEGAGLGITAQLVLDPSALPGWTPLLLIGLVLLRVLALTAYLRSLDPQAAPVRAREVLAQFGRRFLGLDTAAIVAAAFAAFAPHQVWMLGLAGLVAAFAGGWFKFTLVTRAAYPQGFSLPVIPARGAAAPRSGARPGW